MVGEAEARGLAKAELDREGDEVVLGPARELEQGWLFPVIAKKTRAFPSVIVNKRDGRVLHLLHDSPLERDPVLYDRGYQFDVYDLVVHGIDDLDATVVASRPRHDGSRSARASLDSACNIHRTPRAGYRRARVVAGGRPLHVRLVRVPRPRTLSAR